MSVSGFHFSSGSSQSSGRGSADAKSAARNAQSQVQMMGGEIERLLMITEALWIFLKEKHGYSDEDLIKKIAEIDLRDGKLDGKVAREVRDVSLCAHCNRPVGRKRTVCLYCGAAVINDPFDR